MGSEKRPNYERVKAGLKEAILLVCKTGLQFNVELNVEGLLGITLDEEEVFLVNINEVIKTAQVTSTKTVPMTGLNLSMSHRHDRPSTISIPSTDTEPFTIPTASKHDMEDDEDRTIAAAALSSLSSPRHERPPFPPPPMSHSSIKPANIAPQTVKTLLDEDENENAVTIVSQHPDVIVIKDEPTKNETIKNEPLRESPKTPEPIITIPNPATNAMEHVRVPHHKNWPHHGMHHKHRLHRMHMLGTMHAHEMHAKCGSLYDTNLPYTHEDIVNCSVQRFHEMLRDASLTETQRQLMRSLRRRGRNRLAARNSRRRRMNLISNLEQQVVALEQHRSQLSHERVQLQHQTHSLHKHYDHLLTALNTDEKSPESSNTNDTTT